MAFSSISINSIGTKSMLLAMAFIFTNLVNADDIKNPSTSTLSGASNASLVAGSEAIANGDYHRGIELTTAGLVADLTPVDRAGALSNICAGYVALQKYVKALDSCDQSIKIFDGNWRLWQNRAAANLGLGRTSAALRDIERGLALNPTADSLHKTLAIVRQSESRNRRPRTTVAKQ